MFKNMFTDASDRSNSIKYFVTTDLFVKLSKGEKKTIDFSLLKGDLQEKNAVFPDPLPKNVYQMGSINRSHKSVSSNEEYSFVGYVKLDQL